MELMSTFYSHSKEDAPSSSNRDTLHTAEKNDIIKPKKIIIVGAGPAGLFCALQLAQQRHPTTGVPLYQPILLERGQPVESRGRDIGALIHRKSISTESNFAFGEGGAGTWSDGKLTTRIGRNSGTVRHVLTTFVKYGAPEKILVDGSPHLGTDNLVRLLRNMREDLRKMGGEIYFGTKMKELCVDDDETVTTKVVKGVIVEYGNTDTERLRPSELKREDFLNAKEKRKGSVDTIYGDAVVLASGHSARDVYEHLHDVGVQLEPKGFAVGFRIEHPQKIINEIQYGSDWGLSVVTGRGPTDLVNQEYFTEAKTMSSTTTTTTTTMEEQQQQNHEGRLPVASYRLATDKAFDGTTNRGAYSFCMCPGGQIVPASTQDDEVCVNGMSFSKRDSLWANSALVVTVNPNDAILDPYRHVYNGGKGKEEDDDGHVLAGLAFQKDMERKASIMGGGNLTVPVQRVTDFVNGVASTTAPSSSYRLGIKPSACHEIYPKPLVNALRDAIVNHFEVQMPGFLCEDALLHAVETRTSSPVRVSRDAVTLQAVGVKGLFPAGEGAGFAGGIVSAAVDGMIVADAIVREFGGDDNDDDDDGGNVSKKKFKSVGFEY